MFDASFFAALAIALVGLLLLLLVQLFLPLRRNQTVERELQAAGVGVREGVEPGTFRTWQLPSQLTQLLEALRHEVTAIPGTHAPSLQGDVLTVPGRALRFLNVNQVRPLDFRQAEFRLLSGAGSPHILAAQVDFAGFWRAIAVVGLFTIWGLFIIWLSSRRQTTFAGITVVLVAFALIFLMVHYFSQHLVTRNFFDQLVLKAVRRASTTSSGAP